ncbi:MAG: C10 family peptidase [Bacteroidetes bacterium]|nr:C10 family peptidase [Bacteroidota bacterium]
MNHTRTHVAFPILILFIFILTTPLFSKEVSLNDAERVARNFFYERGNQYFHPLAYYEIKVRSTFSEKYDSQIVYYVFNVNDGYVIVSADDAYVPVIGYAYDRAYQSENQPDNYKGWMENYAKQIVFARNLDMEATSEIKSDWNRLMTEDITLLNTTSRSRSINPLLTNLWNQGSPYNAWCPEDASGPGGHVYAGCVATAMSMVMHYWRYPLQGTGSHSYDAWEYGNLSVNYGATTYNWSAMLNEIKVSSFPESIDAVAQLQYHCGVAVNMGYSPTGSGAYSQDVPEAMSSHFNYAADIDFVDKDNYSTTGWITLLQSQLDIGWPMYYSGFNGSGGHAFVCDGYQGEEFHFNFGWSGQNNGYYTVNEVGGFNMGQGAVINIHPGEDYPYFWDQPVTVTSKSGCIEDGSGPVTDYQNNTTMSWLIDPQTSDDSISGITLKFIHLETEQDNDIITIYDGGDTDAAVLGMFSGSYSGNLPVITSTGNKMLVIFTSNDNITAPGFQAEFISTIAEYCNGWITLTDPSGTITDGSGTKPYNDNSLCRWKIDPPDASKVTLTFTSFKTEADHDCLQVIDLSSDPPAEIGKFSGNQIPPSLSTNGTMLLNFCTNGSVTADGWEVTYEIDYVGMDDNTLAENMSIFPNPASNKVNIALTLNNAGSVHIELLTLTGVKVYSLIDEFQAGKNNKILDLTGISKGIYMLRVWNDREVTATKLIVE